MVKTKDIDRHEGKYFHISKAMIFAIIVFFTLSAFLYIVFYFTILTEVVTITDRINVSSHTFEDFPSNYKIVCEDGVNVPYGRSEIDGCSLFPSYKIHTESPIYSYSIIDPCENKVCLIQHTERRWLY